MTVYFAGFSLRSIKFAIKFVAARQKTNFLNFRLAKLKYAEARIDFARHTARGEIDLEICKKIQFV